MLTTAGLEEYMKGIISDKLPDVKWPQIYFKEGFDNSPEGAYVFSKEGKYHFLTTERGKIRGDKVTEDLDEVLWYILPTLAFKIAGEYAKQHKGNGDFRRPYFKKQIEIYSLFGESFKERKINEIEKTLEKYPYVD